MAAPALSRLPGQGVLNVVRFNWPFYAGALLAGTAGLALAAWLWRSRTASTCLALGLLIGGALGNLVDRIAYGAVVDFVYLHAGGFRWYVFNGADCAITAGVVVLLVEWVFGPGGAADAAKTPRSPRHS